MSGLRVNLAQTEPIALAATFECAEGELHALVGPSGSGKSTVLRAIAGTYSARSGRVRVNGEVWLDTAAGICLPPHRRAVGMVFQSYALFPHMTALGNVMAAMGHIPASLRESRGRELLELVHLSGLEHRRPAALSGGQQQRVAVARALAREPRVLLLDEPFAAVDKSTRQRLYREIAELRRLLNMPVVLVTHDLDEATMLADRMTVLHQGRSLQCGSPEEITRHPASAEVAHLVDVRNVFRGCISSDDPQHNRLTIDWNGCPIVAGTKAGLRSGDGITWAIPDGFIVLHRRDRPSRGEHENPVRGHIESLIVIGQTAHLTLRPAHEPALPIHFSVPLHVARRNRIEETAEVTVSLLAEGIHIMADTATAGAE